VQLCSCVAPHVTTCHQVFMVAHVQKGSWAMAAACMAIAVYVC